MMVGDQQDEALRREAAAWFARMRGPGGEAHRADFEAWRAAPANGAAYDRLVRRFDESVVLGHSRLAQMRLQPQPAKHSRRPVYVLVGALAACTIATVAFGILVLRGGAAETRYATAVGQIRPILLADGASMILDTDSIAAISKAKGRQIVRLERGRARFVAPGKTDLAVTVGKAEVLAKDATFDLALDPQSQIAVTVISGAPRLGPVGGQLVRARVQVLAAGRQTLVGPDLATRRVQPASSAEASWPSGLRRFDQARLSEVAAIANRYNTRKIRLADPKLGDLRLTGVFRVTGSDSLAKALAAAFGLNVETSPSGDIVLSRASA